MGKLFSRKAAFSPYVPLKAAIKVNLPISTLYVAWLWTTVIWPSESVWVWQLHSQIFWIVRTRPINTVHGNYDHPECRDCSDGSCSLLEKGEATQKSKVISWKSNSSIWSIRNLLHIWFFKHAESKSRLYTQGEIYSFRGFCPSYCQNSQRLPFETPCYWAKLGCQILLGYMPAKVSYNPSNNFNPRTHCTLKMTLLLSARNGSTKVFWS